MNVENSKTNEPHKYILNVSQRLDLKSSNEHFALQNVTIYYTWKNIRKQYKNIKLKIIAPKWNDRLKFKIKDGYKLELQTPETMKLFGSTKVFSVFENL